jgi:hypothetical protein
MYIEFRERRKEKKWEGGRIERGREEGEGKRGSEEGKGKREEAKTAKGGGEREEKRKEGFFE